MIIKKCSHKNWFKKTLSALMTVTMLSSTSVYAAVEVENMYGQSKSLLTNEELASKVNPVLQSYTADSSMKVWRLTADTRLVVLENEENIVNKRLEEVVKLVNAEFLEKGITSSNPLAMIYGGENEVGENDVLITIDNVNAITDKSTSSEAYGIDIDENGIKLTGASENAILYGLRTIQNLMITNDGLVYGKIVDYPNVAERRLHVDSGRKYFSKDWFIRQIREMSYLKMNTLQMHFSENMGFRIECETDPTIVSDEYLTKVEVREILEEARKYGVKVIPSFDTPGHVAHILKFHKEYGQISNKGTYFDGGLDITNPEAVEYFKSLYREYMELFEGSTDFHIGGDEYMEFDRAPFTTEYKSVLDKYAKESISPNATWKDAVANYINEISELVQEGGFKPRIWNDGIYYGENSYNEKPQTVKMHDYIGIDFWSQMPWNRDIANLNTFVQKGHEDIYNVNSGFFYYVLRNDKPTDGRKQNSFDYLNQDKRIFEEWTPGKFASNTVADDSTFIKGVSMAIWCDNPNLVEEDVITDDISKELRSLATKSWNTRSNTIVSLDKFKENYKILGNVAGFEKGSQLPSVGEFLPAEDLGKVTIKYLSNTGKVLKDDVVKYGIIGKDYTFEADKIYGYSLLSEKAVSGKFTEDDKTYTFTYELSSDKTELEKEIKNSLNENSYIRETYKEYREAFEKAKEVYKSDTSEQQEVDEVLKELLNSKKKAVLLEYYPLYIESEYTLNKEGFISGYDAYLTAVKNGKAELYSDDVTINSMNQSFQTIKTAKENLRKQDGNTPTVTATDKTYIHSGAAWQGPYFPPEKYALDKMVDGDKESKTWFADNQNVGDEIILSFPKQLNMSEIQIVQSKDGLEDIIVNADVEVGTTKGEWIKVGSLTKADGIDKTISFEQRPVQFIRIVIRENAPKWYQIEEIYFTYEQHQESSVLKDMILEAEELDITDKNLTLVSNIVDALIEAQKAYVQNSVDTEKVETDLRSAINALNEEEIVVSKPSNIKGEATSNEVVLTWNLPKETAGLIGYIIYKDGKEFAEVLLNETTFTVTDLKYNTIYGFKVVSKYSNGEKSKPVSINLRTKKD